MKYYVILSTGSYSDYDPQYFVGEKREITQEELDEAGRRVGDEIYDWYDKLPKRKSTDGLVKYDPDTEKRVYEYSSLKKIWFSKMKIWLEDNGFEQAPENIPEININFDLPTHLIAQIRRNKE